MHWIFKFIVAHRRFFSVLLTSLLSLLMLSAPPEKQAATFRFLSITVFYPLQVVLSQSTRIRNIFEENSRLKKEVIRLGAAVAQLQEASVENQRLRSLLNLAENFRYDLLTTRIVAQDPSSSQKSIVVAAGKKDSVAKWMPLVDHHGVVGKVIRVGNGLSLVQLLKDPSNRTSVLFRRTRTTGILETQNGDDFFVRCRIHEPIEPGDTVVTAGLGGIYPRGLMVGTVKSVDKIRDPLFKMVSVTPSVDFDHLEELFIIRLSPQWSAFREELDSLEIGNE